MHCLLKHIAVSTPKAAAPIPGGINDLYSLWMNSDLSVSEMADVLGAFMVGRSDKATVLHEVVATCRVSEPLFSDWRRIDSMLKLWESTPTEALCTLLAKQIARDCWNIRTLTVTLGSLKSFVKSDAEIVSVITSVVLENTELLGPDFAGIKCGEYEKVLKQLTFFSKKSGIHELTADILCPEPEDALLEMDSTRLATKLETKIAHTAKCYYARQELDQCVRFLDSKNNAESFETIPEVHAQITEKISFLLDFLKPLPGSVNEKESVLFRLFCSRAELPVLFFSESDKPGAYLRLAKRYVGQDAYPDGGACRDRALALWRESRSPGYTMVDHVPAYCVELSRLCHELSDIENQLDTCDVVSFCIAGDTGQARPGFLTRHYEKTLSVSVSPNDVNSEDGLLHFKTKLWDDIRRKNLGYDALQEQAAAALEGLFETALAKGKKLLIFDTLGEMRFSKNLLKIFHELSQKYGAEKLAYIHDCSCCFQKPMKYIGEDVSRIVNLWPRDARENPVDFVALGESDPFDGAVLCRPCGDQKETSHLSGNEHAHL